MDYVRPIESLVPGVQGRVLGVLARTEAELTMRTVAELASVSVNRAVVILNHLVHLGVVERREAGSAALVRLARDNEAAQSIADLGRVFDRVFVRLQDKASSITPSPSSVIVFGSFARDEARADSDIDVLIVRPDDVPDDDESWVATVASWVDTARAITGNPVNLIEVGASEVPRLLKRRDSLWQYIERDARVLFGPNLDSLAGKCNRP